MPAINPFFLDLIKAIHEDNLAKISLLLSFHPELIEHHDEQGANLIHRVMKESQNPEVLETLYPVLQKYRKTSLLIEKDGEGFAPVHYAAQFASPMMLTAFLSLIEPNQLYGVVRTTAQDRRTFELAALNEEYKEENTRILKQIYSPPSYEPVYLPAILAKYPEAKKKNELRENFSLACEVVNHTRALFYDSATHALANTYSKQETDDIDQRINVMRDDWFADPRAFAAYTKDDKDAIIDLYYDYAKKHHIGNCHEFAHVALKMLEKLNPGKTGEVLIVKTGKSGEGHAFMVFDRDPKCKNIKNFASWGPNAVVCDAHTGEVYPAKDIPKRLHYQYFNESTMKNEFKRFDPKKHNLEVSICKPGIPEEKSPALQVESGKKHKR